MSRTDRILIALVVALVVLSVSVGVLLFRDRQRTTERVQERDQQFTLVCDKIATLREGIIGAFGRLGTDLDDPDVKRELDRLRDETDCVFPDAR